MTNQVLEYEQMEIKNNQKIAELNDLKAVDEKVNNNQDLLIELASKISYIEGERKALMGLNDDDDFEEIFKRKFTNIN